MEFLSEDSISCPYCGERINVLLDSSQLDEVYIEDCQVCCRPIVFRLSLSEEGSLSAHVRTEDEIF